MALRQYRIPAFYGLNQSVSENRIDAGESPDACNMDTSSGNLAVAKGYVRANETAFSAPTNALGLHVWRRGENTHLLVAATDGLYTLSAGAWTKLFPFANVTAEGAVDFQNLKIDSTEYLLLANGKTQMVKWDAANAASAFGSAENLSNVATNFVELYFSRLFAAGDADHPCRLYWSSAPGSNRSVENWASDEASENVGGGHVEIGTDSDPITGLFALSNQLLIFKRDSLYRLLGDRPSNYRVLPVSGAVRLQTHTACVRNGDVAYFLTTEGLTYFDGQNVKRMADADKVKTFLAGASLSRCMGAIAKDKLCFAVREAAGTGANDAILVYDLIRGCYMVRRGFLAYGLCASGGVLYILDGNGYVCRFDEGDDYAGARIEAYWNTPMTDLDQKIASKRLSELYLRGTGGILSLKATTGGGTVYAERLMPGQTEDILELGLSGGGRAFRLTFENVNGSRFTIDGGVELLIDMQRRAL